MMRGELMPTVTLRYFALFREVLGRREERRAVPEGTTARDLLALLAEETPALAGLGGISRFIVNQVYVDGGTTLHEGDEVVFIPPVSGGEAGAARRFRIVDEPLAIEPVAALVADPGAGAIITFAGVVRDHARGKGVVALEYEAYAPVAERMLAQIASELAARWPVLRVAIWHRVGRLAVGETSVVIALSVPHRQEGFAACAYAIERLKEIVPIWKKEIYADGATWIGSEAAYQALPDRTA
jgi:molybdopterin synthase catalytic subunit